MQFEKKKKTVDTIYRCGLILSIAAFILNFISFVTPYWIVVRPEFAEDSKFIRLGLWEACFDKYVHPEDYVSKAYSGCWYVYYPEYDYIRNWLNPPWFYAAQMLSLLDFILQLGVVIVLGLKGCKIIEKRHAKSDRFVIVLQLINTFCFATVVILMGVMSKDRTWLPRFDHNQVSWSFSFAVIAGFFTAFSVILFSLRFLRVHCTEGLLVGLGCRKSTRPLGALDPRDDNKNGGVDNSGLEVTTSAALAAAKHRDAYQRGDLNPEKYDSGAVGVPPPDYIGYYRGPHGSFTHYTDTLV